jgi:hypothetical protein
MPGSTISRPDNMSATWARVRGVIGSAVFAKISAPAAMAAGMLSAVKCDSARYEPDESAST